MLGLDFFLISPRAIMFFLAILHSLAEFHSEGDGNKNNKKRIKKWLLELGRQGVSRVKWYQSQTRLATEILVFQMKEPNLDK